MQTHFCLTLVDVHYWCMINISRQFRAEFHCMIWWVPYSLENAKFLKEFSIIILFQED